jgi:hypothetical protein
MGQLFGNTGGKTYDREWRHHEKALHKAKFKPILDKGESDRIENANHLYRTDRCNMARNRGWLPLSVDASRGCFPSATADEEPGSRANEARDAVAPMFTC